MIKIFRTKYTNLDPQFSEPKNSFGKNLLEWKIRPANISQPTGQLAH